MSVEEEHLARAIRRIEDELYRRVLRRVAATLMVAGVLLTASIALVGWLTWSALRRSLYEGAVTTLQADDSLRASLLTGLGLDTAGYADLIERLSRVETAGNGPVATQADVAELQRMLETLLGEPVAEPFTTRRSR